MERRYAQTDDDTAEHAHLQRRNTQHGSGGVRRHGINAAVGFDHGVNRDVHHQIGDRARKSRDRFFLLRHADRDAHREQQRQIAEHGAAALRHQIKNGIGDGALMDRAVKPVGLEHDGVRERAADTQQQTRDGQQRDGQHERPADPLQDAEDFVFHLMIPPVS